MKFICSNKEILKASQFIDKIISSRFTQNFQVGSNLILQVEQDHLKLISNNIESQIEVTIPVEDAKEGITTVSLKTFIQIISKLKSESITIETTEKTLRIIHGKSKVNIVTLPIDQSLLFNKMEEEQVFEIEASNFKQLIKNVIFAVAKDENKPILNSVLFDFGYSKKSKKSFRVVACDSIHMAISTGVLNERFKNILRIIGPFKILNEISNFINNDGMVQFNCTDKQMAIQYNNVYIITRLVQGNYPDIQAVIDAFETKIILSVNVQKLRQALDICSVVADQHINGIDFSIEDNELILHVQSEIGKIEERIEIKNKEIISNDFSSAYLNCLKMLEGLKAIKSDEVILKFGNSMLSIEEKLYFYLLVGIKKVNSNISKELEIE